MVVDARDQLPVIQPPGSAPGGTARCAGCGACCALLSLSGNHESYRFLLSLPNAPVTDEQRQNAAFILEHMHPISVRLAVQINQRKVFENIHGNFYLCDRYDGATQRCLAYDERPPLCRGFPTYGLALAPEELARGLEAYPRCSFWADVPEALHPDFVEPLPSPAPENVC